VTMFASIMLYSTRLRELTRWSNRSPE